MKIFDISSFEKLKIRPVNVNNLNNFSNELTWIIYPYKEDFSKLKEIYTKIKNTKENVNTIINQAIKLYNSGVSNDVVIKNSIENNIYVVHDGPDSTDLLFVFGYEIEPHIQLFDDMHTKIWTSKHSVDDIITLFVSFDVKFKDLEKLEKSKTIEAYIEKI